LAKVWLFWFLCAFLTAGLLFGPRGAVCATLRLITGVAAEKALLTGTDGCRYRHEGIQVKVDWGLSRLGQRVAFWFLCAFSTAGLLFGRRGAVCATVRLITGVAAEKALLTGTDPCRYRHEGSQISMFQVLCETGIPVSTGNSHAKFVNTSAT
jgi:hypothetical protein